ncbi:MAG: hypothetical protein R3C05_28540 [Pirellulaceae bacterium]
MIAILNRPTSTCLRTYPSLQTSVLLEKSKDVMDVRTGFSGMPFVWSRDGGRVAAEGLDKHVRVWDAQTGKLLCVIQSAVASLLLSPDGKILADSAESYGKLNLWNAESGELIRTLAAQSNALLFWLDDGKRIGAKDSRGETSIWDVSTGQLVERRQGIVGNPPHALSPNGKLARVLVGPCVIRFEELATNRDLGTLVIMGRDQYVKVNPNGHFSGSPNVDRRLIYIVKTSKGQQTYTCEDFAAKFDWQNDPGQL